MEDSQSLIPYLEFADKARTCRQCGMVGGGLDREEVAKLMWNNGKPMYHIHLTTMKAVCPKCWFSWSLV